MYGLTSAPDGMEGDMRAAIGLFLDGLELEAVGDGAVKGTGRGTGI